MFTTKRALLAGMAATGFGLTAARPASAQTYPTRVVKMVVHCRRVPRLMSAIGSSHKR
jgi:hypothetical protein